MDNIYFVTTNQFKTEEVKKLFEDVNNVKLKIISNINITEIMDLELDKIVRDKLLKAHREIGLPCIVEHGALHVEYLNRLPGGLSKVVWDNLKDKLTELLPEPPNQRKAVAKTIVGYCDGKKMHFFTGETNGEISLISKGSREFQWDPIFIPEGETKTYAELEMNEKLKYSQAIKAWKKLLIFLEENK